MSISEMYHEVIELLAEKAKLCMEDGDEQGDAITHACDDTLIYYEDRAVIVAQAFAGGWQEYGAAIDWEEIEERLRDDIKEELDKLN